MWGKESLCGLQSEHVRTTQRHTWHSRGGSYPNPNPNLDKGAGGVTPQAVYSTRSRFWPHVPDTAPASSAHSEKEPSQRGLFQQRNGNVSMQRFTGCLQKMQKERKQRKTTTSKQLNHPVDILGLYKGRWWCGGYESGSSAVVFCTTDSQCVHGRLLSLDVCTFPG